MTVQHLFEALQARDVYLVSGDFASESCGLVRRPSADFDAGWLQGVLLCLASEEQPQVINLAILRDILGPSPSASEVAGALSNARVSVFGTDGSRGEVRAEDTASVGEALAVRYRDGLLVPRFFRALSAAIIRARRLLGARVEAVVVGWDTRDMWGDGRFREAIVEGAMDTGCHVYVSGTTPIANSCYVLAELAQMETPKPSIAFNKTASHNPPSHDGLKTFVLADAEKGPPIRKLRPAEESVATALLFAELIAEQERAQGSRSDVVERSRETFSRVMTSASSSTPLRAGAIVYDGSNGAAGAGAYAQIMKTVIAQAAPEAESITLCACEPDGRNINDRCGAGSLEGLQFLDESGLRGRGFASLDAVFDQGRRRAEKTRRDGRLVFGLAVDGDSDRSYVFFYDPFVDGLRFIDGDSAILLQVRAGLAAGTLKVGDKIAFTIESAANFVEELQRLVAPLGASTVTFLGEALESQGLALIATPVGDKWVLAAEPSVGGEATGHIIRPATVPTAAGDIPGIYAGNGPLGLLTTAAAVECCLQDFLSDDGEVVDEQAFARGLATFAQPYPEGNAQVTYAYFVERGRLYRGSRVWQRALAIIDDAIAAHAADYERREVSFAEDPNTAIVLLTRNGAVRASLHLRCSGTEAKVGCKMSAAAGSPWAELLAAIDEEMFFLLAETMGDRSSPHWQRQRRALATLCEESMTWPALSALLAEAEGRDLEPVFEAQLAGLRAALRKQRLVEQNDGMTFGATERGRSWLELIGSKSDRG